MKKQGFWSRAWRTALPIRLAGSLAVFAPLLSMAQLRNQESPDPATGQRIVTEAKALAAGGKPDEAQSLARRAVQDYPNWPTAHDLLGSLLLQAAHLDEAEAQFAAALRAAPQDVDAHRGMASVWYLRGQTHRAVQELRAALSAAPDQLDVRKDLTTLLVAQKRHREAIELWEELVRVNPLNGAAQDQLGLLLLSSGAYGAAEERFALAHRQQPGDVTVLYHLAMARLERYKLIEAAADLRRVIEARPDDAPAHFALGVALSRQGEARLAIAEFEHSLRSAPNAPETQFELGLALVQAGDDRRAISAFTEAIRIHPNHVGARVQLGLLLYRLGKTPAAKAQFAVAVALRADDATAHYRLGLCHRADGEFDDAIAHFREALRLRPDWTEPMIDLASILATAPEERHRDGAAAAGLARRATALREARTEELLSALAAAEAERGDYGQAVRLQQRAIEIATGALEKAGTGPATAPASIPSLSVAEMHRRLESYRASRPYRLRPSAGGPTSAAASRPASAADAASSGR